jgi:transcriptional antiterminator NusG
MIRYYTIQVKTGFEKRFMRFYGALYPEKPLALHFLQKELPRRKLGIIRKKTSALLPGYIFVELMENRSIREYYWELRRTPNFFRFLVSNRDIRPLAGNELDVIRYLLERTSPVAGISRVKFDENSRIMVLEGPLKGFEGRIIKVDKRKGRARVQLDLYSESHWIDLAFEVITTIKDPKKHG